MDGFAHAAVLIILCSYNNGAIRNFINLQTIIVKVTGSDQLLLACKRLDQFSHACMQQLELNNISIASYFLLDFLPADFFEEEQNSAGFPSISGTPCPLHLLQYQSLTTFNPPSIFNSTHE